MGDFFDKIETWAIVALNLAMAAILLLLLLSGCCPCKHLTTEVKDSTTTSLVVVQRVDTILVEVPREVYVNNTTDSISVIVGELATSTAEVVGGRLRHTLEVGGKAQVLTTSTDTTRSYNRERVVVNTITTNKLTKWQKSQIAGFWIILAAAVILLFSKIAKKVSKI